MKPGEVWWVEYPTGDGHEQAGGRPGLVIQDDAVGARSPLVLTIPLTTSAGVARRLPATLFVAADAANGLAADSYALVFQLRATDRRRFRNRVGVVSPAVLAQVYQALDQLTGHP